jgi:hypothetical protein
MRKQTCGTVTFNGKTTYDVLKWNGTDELVLKEDQPFGSPQFASEAILTLDLTLADGKEFKISLVRSTKEKADNHETLELLKKLTDCGCMYARERDGKAVCFFCGVCLQNRPHTSDCCWDAAVTFLDGLSVPPVTLPE